MLCNCGSTDHIAKYCPNRGTGRNAKRRSNSVAVVARKAARKSAGNNSKTDKVTTMKKSPSRKDKTIAKLEKQGKLLAAQVAKLSAAQPTVANDEAEAAHDHLNLSGADKSAPPLSKKLRAALNYFNKK